MYGVSPVLAPRHRVRRTCPYVPLARKQEARVSEELDSSLLIWVIICVSLYKKKNWNEIRHAISSTDNISTDFVFIS